MGIEWEQNKTANGLVPCLSTAHMMYNTRSMRPLCGLEQMSLQGFEDVETGEGTDGALKDRELRLLSGNTITVPVVGAIFAVVLGSVEKVSDANVGRMPPDLQGVFQVPLGSRKG